MFTKIFHQYSHYANKTVEWLPADTQARYEENLKINYSQLKENDWLDKKFTYSFNQHGFRCDEFTSDPSIMFLGCSHTCGIGLPIENSWAYLVSKKLNLNMVNLGIGGSGPDTSFKLANHYIPQLKPNIVVYFEPNNARFGLIDIRRNITEFSPWNSQNDTYNDFYNAWASNEENLNLNGLKHKLAIEAICNRNNIKLITFNDNYFLRLDLARDLLHNGIKSNEEFSKIVLNAI